MIIRGARVLRYLEFCGLRGSHLVVWGLLFVHIRGAVEQEEGSRGLED